MGSEILVLELQRDLKTFMIHLKMLLCEEKLSREVDISLTWL